MIRSRMNKALLILAVAIAALAPIDRASAQGTLGAFPDPISSHDLNEYAQRLGLSDQQLLALSQPHTAYLERFRDLREREIEAFIDEFRGIGRGVRRFDPALFRRLEPMVKEYDRLITRMRTLDEQFFSEMHSVLTAQQADLMPRIRQHRERLRYSGEATRFVDFINPTVRVDLSAMLRELELPPNELQSIDPILIQYENRLTTNARRIFNAAVKTVIAGLKELDELGFDEETMREPREVMRLFNAAQEIWDEITGDLLKEAGQITQLNRNTFRQLAQTLPDDSARALRERFYGRAYAEAAGIGRASTAHFDAALQMDLPADLASSVRALAAAHTQKQNRRADQVADLLDERRRNLTLMQVVRRGNDATRERIEQITAAAAIADEAAIETLHAMLGPDLAARLNPSIDAPATPRRIVVRGGGGPPGAGPVWRGRGMHQGAIDFLTQTNAANRISAADLREYAERMDLDDSGLVLLESFHDEYIAGFEQLRAEVAVPFANVLEELRQDGSETSPDFAEKIHEAFRLLEALLAGSQQLDHQFFSDVRVALIDAEDDSQNSTLRSLRAARDRQRYQLPVNENRPIAFGGNDGESRVDLTQLLTSISLTSESEGAIAPVVEQYEVAASDMFRAQFETEMAVHLASLRFSLSRNEELSQEERRRHFREMRERMTEVRTTARQRSDSLKELNRETLDGLLAALAESDGAVLLDRYHREAYPAAFDDPDAAELRIQAALNLSTLGESQRSRVLEIAADYRPRYAELTNSILATHRRMADESGFTQPGNFNWRGRMDQASDLEKLQFDRSELNERTMRELRAVLNPDQLAMLP